MHVLKSELNQLFTSNEAILKFFLEEAFDGLWYVSLENFKDFYINNQFWMSLGYDPDDVENLPKDWELIVHPDDVNNTDSSLHTWAANPNTVADITIRLKHKNGHFEWFRCKGKVIKGPDGKFSRALGIYISVENEKQFEQKLLQQNDRLSYILEGTNVGTWEWNIQTGATIFNERWASIIGYTLKELEPISIETWAKYAHPEDLEGSNKMLEAHFRGDVPFYETEARMKHKNGHWVWVLDRGKVFAWDETGKPLLMAGTHQDITNRKQTESELLKFKSLLDKVNEASRVGIWEVDLEAQVPKWSKVTKEIHEVPDDFEPNIHTAINFYKEGESRNRVKEAVQLALEKGINYDIELEIVTAQGNEKWVRAVGISEMLNGKCIRHYGTFQDISERKKQEIQLRQSEEQFRKTFEHSAIGMAILNDKGQWMQVNDSLCKIVGYTREELQNLTFQAITHPDDLDADLELLQELIAGSRETYQLEKRYFHKDGHVVWIILAASMVKKEDGSPLHFIAQITDITEKKLAENKLNASIAQLQSLLDASTHVSIISTDLNGIITSFNKGAENLLGYAPAEVIFKQTPIIFHKREEVELRAVELEQQFGTPFRGFDIFSALAKTGQYDSREWTYIHKNGQSFPVQLVITGLRGVDGIINGFLGIATDISQIKKAETEVKALLDVAGDQNKRLLNFAHIVSHNLRSHAGNLSMLLDLIDQEEDLEARKEMYPMLREASNNLNETLVHLNEVVALHKSASDELRPIQLSKSIQRALGNLQGLLQNARAEYSCTIDDSIYVQGVPAYLDSILVNLISNAIKYKQPDLPLKLHISAHRLSSNRIEIDVQDNGMGIDLKRYGEKLFGMYKTFHRHQDARGVGLFITKNQVEAMGGKITVDSTPLQGSTFKIELHETPATNLHY